MKKFLIYLKLLLTVPICLSLAGLCLTAGSALAAEESDQMLENVGQLLQKAAVAAKKAKETGDLDLSKEALEQANTAAGLLLRVADLAQKAGNAELALVALNMAQQTSSVISDILTISRETVNADLALAALNVAEQTSLLVSNIATMAQETDNPPLAQAALSAVNNIGAMITQVTETARVVAQTSTDPATVEAAEKVVTKSETVQDLNTQAESTALATGALPEEGEGFSPATNTPLQEEPPIEDTEPASEV